MMSKPTGRPTGRPQLYTPELADEILERISNGENQIKICEDEHIPSYAVISRWVRDDVEGFQAKYACARDIQADYIAEQVMVVSSEALGVATGKPGTGEAGAKVMAKKILADNMKWFAGNMSSKYSNRVKQEISGPDGGAIKTESAPMELTPELAERLNLIDKVSGGMTRPEGIEE
jgi:hypothetical protein